MTARIDLQKSIINERLVYKGHILDLLFQHFTSYFGCLGTITFFGLLLLNTYFKDYPTQTILFLFLLTSIVLINSYFIDKLFVKAILNKKASIKQLTRSLEERYPKIKFDTSSSTIITATTKSRFWWFDREFTLLFVDEKLAINLSVFGRGKMKYCLTGLYNYYLCKKIVNSLKPE
jgi:hypothetical protein